MAMGLHVYVIVYLLDYAWTNNPQAPSDDAPTKRVLQRILNLTLSVRCEPLHAPSLALALDVVGMSPTVFNGSIALLPWSRG